MTVQVDGKSWQLGQFQNAWNAVACKLAKDIPSLRELEIEVVDVDHLDERVSKGCHFGLQVAPEHMELLTDMLPQLTKLFHEQGPWHEYKQDPNWPQFVLVSTGRNQTFSTRRESFTLNRDCRPSSPQKGDCWRENGKLFVWDGEKAVEEWPSKQEVTDPQEDLQKAADHISRFLQSRLETKESKSSRNRVYVAGPYTAHSTEQVLKNVHIAIRAGERLRAAGYVPFVPHLYHFWHEFSEHDYQYWMDLDKEWLKACDIFCRIEGESPGGDKEMQWAHQLRIPVFRGVEQLLDILGPVV